MNKLIKLQNLHKKWTYECQCILKNAATQAVLGCGSVKADIVFVGEAPGKKEDELGIPFVGAAGKFLDEMLVEIKLARKDIYITNIVKYHPPNNRDPSPKETASCRLWLLEEIQLISPKLVVFLGRHAMNNFFPKLKISSAHGKLITKKFRGIKTKYFLPLYHPAAALHNGSLRKILITDFKKIPKTLREIEKFQHKG